MGLVKELKQGEEETFRRRAAGASNSEAISNALGVISWKQALKIFCTIQESSIFWIVHMANTCVLVFRGESQVLTSSSGSPKSCSPPIYSVRAEWMSKFSLSYSPHSVRHLRVLSNCLFRRAELA